MDEGVAVALAFLRAARQLGLAPRAERAGLQLVLVQRRTATDEEVHLYAPFCWSEDEGDGTSDRGSLASPALTVLG